MRAEVVYIVELFLIVYIPPSLSVAPVPFLVTIGADVVVNEVVPILSNRHSFL